MPSDIERWIDARLSEAEDTLVGAYGEPEYEEAYTDLLAEIVGPFAVNLRGAVERIGQLERALLMAGSWLPEPRKQTVREVLGASTTPLGGR